MEAQLEEKNEELQRVGDHADASPELVPRDGRGVWLRFSPLLGALVPSLCLLSVLRAWPHL